MTFWAEVFLGVIALAMVTMAAVQVGAIMQGWRVARRLDRLLAQVEQEMKPLAENLNAVARDAARASGMAVGQVERMDRLVTDVAVRLEQTATTVQDAVLTPLREGAAVMAGVRAAIDLFRDVARRPGGGRTRNDEDGPLFIG